jgi:hypothetical protein
MQKTLLNFMAIGAILLSGAAIAQPIYDNFDGYNLGPLSSQAAHWVTWGGGQGTAEDASVTNMESFSPNQSLLVAEGGVQDMMLLLGNQVGGVYHLEWKVMIPIGKTAYYNIQQSQTPGVGWNLDVYFNQMNNNPGVATMIIGTAPSGNFNFTHGEWFTLRHIIDLDANTLELFKDDVSVFTMNYPNNLGAVNFYSIDANNRYYIDDVEYEAIVEVVPPVNDNCSDAIDITPGTYDFTTIAATTDGPDQPGSLCDVFEESNINQDIWYTYTASCNGTAMVSTCNTANFDTRIAIYNAGTCPIGAEGLITCNDDGDGCLLFTSIVEWDVTEGESYLIRIGGYDETEVGSGTFELSEDCGVSVAENDALSVKLYPNPVENVAFLDLSNSAADQHEVKIYDLSGRQHQMIILTGKQIHSINTAALATGMYLMSISANGYEKVQKMVVK